MVTPEKQDQQTSCYFDEVRATFIYNEWTWHCSICQRSALAPSSGLSLSLITVSCSKLLICCEFLAKHRSDLPPVRWNVNTHMFQQRQSSCVQRLPVQDKNKYLPFVGFGAEMWRMRKCWWVCAERGGLQEAACRLWNMSAGRDHSAHFLFFSAASHSAWKQKHEIPPDCWSLTVNQSSESDDGHEHTEDLIQL